MKWQTIRNFIFLIFLSIVVVSTAVYTFWSDDFNIQDIRRNIGNFGVYAPVLFIIIYIIAVTFLPSTPFMAASGILFGFTYGLIYTIIAGFINSVVIFYISRKLGKRWVDSILEHKYAKLIDKYNQKLGSDGFWDLILLRIAPVMPFNILNILMGVSKIRPADYIFGTLIGLLPSNFLSVYFGDVITKLF